MASYHIVFKDDELYHHGIKGQRWGVRRYQNEDGTLTPAGKIRYAEVYGKEGGKVPTGKVDEKTIKKMMSKDTIDSLKKGAQASLGVGAGLGIITGNPIVAALQTVGGFPLYSAIISHNRHIGADKINKLAETNPEMFNKLISDEAKHKKGKESEMWESLVSQYK